MKESKRKTGKFRLVLRERAYLKEMKEIELKLIQEQKAQESVMEHIANSTMHGGAKAKLPKLPHFNEQKDDMDAYLRRFERFATSMGWPHSEWSMSLSALLTGKALDVYSRLSVEQASDYDQVKTSLLYRFQLTEEGFRVKFRSTKPEQSERYLQFVDRLHSYLVRWMDLGKTPQRFDALKDLIIREQMLNVCDKDLSLFLKERKPKSADEMAKMADNYVEAHNAHYLVGNKPKKEFVNTKNFVREVQSRLGKNPEQKWKSSESEARHCFVCGKRGHFARNCPDRRDRNLAKPQKGAALELESKDTEHIVAACVEIQAIAESTDQLCGVAENSENAKLVHVCCHNLPVISAVCMVQNTMPVLTGYVGEKKVNVLRDSGCSTVVVKNSLVSKHQMSDVNENCVMLDGTVRCFPVAQIQVDTPYFVGSVKALCLENPLYELVLGNVPGVRDPHNPDPHWGPHSVKSMLDTKSQNCDQSVAAVETRAQQIKRQKPFKPLKIPESTGLSATRSEIENAQKTDSTLVKLWDLADKGQLKVTGTGNESRYLVKDNLLHREYKSPNCEHGKPVEQLVVPQKFRKQVLELAHDSPMAGHMRVKKTLDRAQAHFYWPGIVMCKDTVSCDICQRTVTKGSVGRVLLGQMPLIDTPFRRVAVDLVGPIDPITENGNIYILTLVDYATRYPEAVALPRIETERVAEALVEIFSRMGVPQEILSDRGSQFTSEMMKEVGRLLSMRQLTTTPYHPMCNGLVEKFNGTLKKMLRKMCVEKPKDWDRYLPALLYAYREVPQESLNFSPFELML